MSAGTGAGRFDAREPMQALLASWAERQWLRPLDTAFAEFLWREVPEAPPFLILAAALASHQLGRGHACLDLAATLKAPAFALSLPPEGASAGTGPADALERPALPTEVFDGLSLGQWQQALAQPRLVGSGAGNTPLVCIGARLYLRRYWQYEQDVRGAIERRLAMSSSLQAALPIAALRQTLDALFPPATAVSSDSAATDWQKIACALAARSGFSIITGGPGTGKTTTVVSLLALLQALALERAANAHSCGHAARALRIRLAAPTGKAAARLNESIANAVARLPLADLAHGEAVRAAIPVTVRTLHRLLGSRPDTRRFRHHAGNPLALDVLVIDEASMVDLEMMAAVLAALPTSARLILLGDKDQLASVEAGALLGELCQRARDGHYTPATRDWLEQASGEPVAPELLDAAGTALDQAVVMLRHSHRFAAGSGIGQLAEAVNAGDAGRLGRVWQQAHADLAMLPLVGGDEAAFKALVIDGGLATAVPASAFEHDDEPGAAASLPPRRGYGHYLEVLRQQQPAATAKQQAFDDWARAVLRAHGQFQVLCALRRGPWGVAGLNQRIARVLREADLLPASDGCYLGRPLLITRNDYGLGLMNGDIGITLALPGAGDREWILRVAFPAGDAGQGIKWVLPSRLQAVETAYALTVHKAQGSEFSHAALFLPETLSPILTRELLYTGITRARSFLTVAMPGTARLLEEAAQRQVLRASGLLADGE
ncbi:MAG: Exodeoxyribonuclease V alpha chain [Candidatus Accumulibacter appositus]|uniref:RecBCD enzyme subunit RecD n=1 Tax=Candidatus Accumulibacter appositus TaxID=1454003 RepID=A0A011N6Z5_9PROT|nr:exodeoxyribonuclease V subunit alpha [Accumulibacter sp.]EXI78368.1 MAG: Exodeoxyribonuclease V alpha chain [Candidatus Accumulibacter appositus]HRF06620.1 exodeoxyribonuclease V subunit alpha [Accumulibacter sp.]